ncbi:long-chain-fatty-acid--CoA ligase heimdall-like [Bactrocera tryoni]|uniref:long-chain-fatty-acid--CoA ligase heimdall-like n=1 Tax=Bactrocera tryoni TaxID=59916 RepID=UPI001A960A54|nr:long-chain-fatty-acid--CoA ligase heimdall-like [Bactrocera tryoni]
MSDGTKEYATLNRLKPATSFVSTSLSEPVLLSIGKQGLTAAAPQTIPQLFRDCCRRFPHSPALAYERYDSKNGANTNIPWATTTYAEYERNVEKAALALLHIGLTENSNVCVLAHNCPEWYYVQFGALLVGAVVSGIYLTSSPEAVKHALEASAATVCVVGDATQLAKVCAVRTELPLLRAVILLEESFEDNLRADGGYYLWTDLMALTFDPQLRQELLLKEKQIAANQCALLIFTSGTTGLPKVVMLSHDAIVSNIKFCYATVGPFRKEPGVTMSYLPLNHVAAQLFEVLMPLLCGDCVYFADRDALKGKLIKNLQIAQPTRLFGVPRVYEKIQEELLVAEASSSYLWRLLSSWAKRVLLKSYFCNADGLEPKRTLSYICASLIVRKFKAQVGLGQCAYLWAGGAPLSAQAKKYFLSMDIPVADMFGSSEAGGAMTLTRSYCHLDSSGRVMLGIEAKIDKPNEHGQGEICLRGRCVMMGYLNNVEKTHECIDSDGWMHSGDVGRLSTDGCLHITGRIKDIVITAGGENIPPLYIENLIKAELPCVSNALVVGDKRKFLVVLLTLKTDIDNATGLPHDTLHLDTVSWLKSLDIHYTRLSEVLNIPAFTPSIDYKGSVIKPDQKVVAAVEAGLTRANRNALSRAQRVQKFALLPHDFTVPTGELGPTLKSRRAFICEKYADIIEELYKEGSRLLS